jgi:2,3-bisphosphoglycerate-independent phosphoglycerate mutase
MQPRPILLLILDGWGYRESLESNAIATANTPNFDQLWQNFPRTTLSGSGLDVGLPPCQMGNSEVGHLTIAAGRTIDQDLSRISHSISNHSFYQNPVLQSAFKKVVANRSVLHVFGLLSDGGVHSHETHIHALIECAKHSGVTHILLHPFLDGRDTPPQSAEKFITTLEKQCGGDVRIGSLSGRYYAMDRDNRYERIEPIYRLLTEGTANYSAPTAIQGLKQAYDRQETDEFVAPTLIGAPQPIQDNDAVVFMNFRTDRTRQLTHAFVNPHFQGFQRSARPVLADFVTLTEYAKDLKTSVIFPPTPLTNLLGEFLQTHHLRQLRIAETEKYAHVTFFFNGGREICFEGEERILIPSSKVATYDLKPEMSAVEITNRLVEAILHDTFDVIVCNFANADMVGHTGNFEATVKAIETLDICLGRIIEALHQVNGEALITADHGNAETLFDPVSKQPHTAHTCERVPLLYIGRPAQFLYSDGTLADIAPTLIRLLGLIPPKEMTARCLLQLQ